ncbi:MAG: YfhO family protein [Clostridia bacterium]|nr:YfhO family protein [Clostridia bacterium]
MHDLRLENGIEQTENRFENRGVFSRALHACGGFFKRNAAPCFAALAVVVLYLVQLALYGVYPFGSYTVASYDLSAQICPFVEHLFDVMDGKSALFYSYAVAGGADVFGSLAYFFISPFSFLFLLFGDGNVAKSCFLIVCLKLGTIAFSGSFFARKYFKNIPAYLCAAIGIVYAYCGYTFVANTYINWLDFLIYAPFIAGAFIKFCKTEKFLAFSVLLACAVYTCFSIACFSFFTLFPALVAYAFLCVEKEQRKGFIAKLCLAFLVTVVLSLPVLLPCLSAYLKSGRSDGGLFKNVFFGFKNGAFGGLETNAYFERWSSSLYSKWSYILTDAIFVLLTLTYLIRSKLKTGLSKFMAIAGVLTLLPVIVDEAMLLLNMGSYMSYALRFGFLNAIYFLGGACLALDGLCYQKKRAYDGKPLRELPVKLKKEGGRGLANDSAKPKRKTPKMFRTTDSFINGYTLTLFFVVVAILAFLGFFTISGAYWDIWGAWFKDDKGLNAERFFSSSFAHSLGGLPTIVTFFVCVAIVFVVAVITLKKRRASVRFVSWLILAVLVAQVIFFNEQLVLGNRSVGDGKLAEYTRICQTLNEREDGYYRVKDANDKLSANAPFTADTNSFSVFSSVIDDKNFEIYALFGVAGNGKNSLKSRGGNVFANAFLGNKYYVYDRANTEDADVLSYLNPVKTEAGETLGDRFFQVYENEIAFPYAYVLPSGDFRFVKENTKENRTANQKALYEFLGGTPFTAERSVSTSETRSLCEKLRNRAADLTVGAGKITATVTAQKGECLFLNFVASDGYSVTVNGKKAKLIENDLHFLSVELENGKNVVEFTYSTPYAKLAGWGVLLAAVLLCGLALTLKKTRIFERITPVVAWAGIVLAVAVVGFFMAFPTLVWLYKLLWALIGVF